MVVGAADEAELVRVGAELRLVVEALGHGPAHEVLLLELAPAERPDAVGVLEARELVGRPELPMDLRVALDLHHLDQPLEVAAQARVVCRDRLAGIVERLEHQPLAAIGVVRNRQQPRALLLLLGHPRPELLLVGAVERRERHVRDVQVTEDDVAMHVPGLRRGRPLVARQRRELAGPVVVDRGLDLDILPGAARRLGTGVERRVSGVAPRLLLTTYFRNQARCSSTLLRLRNSSSIGLSPPLAPGTCVEYISPMNSAWSETATQSSGRPMLCFWPLTTTSAALRELVGLVRRDPGAADVGVERVGRVHVRLAEVGVLQRVLRNRGLEFLDGRRRGGGRRGGRHRSGRLVVAPLAASQCEQDRERDRCQSRAANSGRGLRVRCIHCDQASICMTALTGLRRHVTALISCRWTEGHAGRRTHS